MKSPLALLALALLAGSASAQPSAQPSAADNTDENLLKGQFLDVPAGYARAYNFAAIELIDRGHASIKAGEPGKARPRFHGAQVLVEAIIACALPQAGDSQPKPEVLRACELPSIKRMKTDNEKLVAWLDYGNQEISARDLQLALQEARMGVKRADDALKKKAEKIGAGLKKN